MLNRFAIVMGTQRADCASNWSAGAAASRNPNRLQLLAQSAQKPVRQRRAFSLLEIMIAIGVLGIGLIMVAAIFPVALTQHKDSIEKSRSLDMLNKAEALLRSRIDTSKLWFDALTPPGADTPWNMLPMANLQVGSNGPNPWDWMPNTTPYFSSAGTINPGLSAADYLHYANCLNFSYDASPGNPFSLTAIPPLEMLSDRKAPLTVNPWSPMNDDEFQAIENRFVWIGFYRRLANGSSRFAVAVNRLLRGERYAEQDMSTVGLAGPGFMSRAGGVPRRLPVPWRVTVRYNPQTRRMYNTADPEGLGELAPPGSKIMVGGFIWRNGNVVPSPTMPVSPAGRILTVTNVFDNTNDGVENPETVDFLEDPTGLPEFAPSAQPQDQYFFDVIVFPPPFVGVNGNNVQFGRKSPLIQWKVNL